MYIFKQYAKEKLSLLLKIVECLGQAMKTSQKRKRDHQTVIQLVADSDTHGFVQIKSE